MVLISLQGRGVLKIKEKLITLEGNISHYDEALFLWFENNVLIVVMPTYVHDLFWSGDCKFEMKEI